MFKFIAQGKNSIIVEHIETKKRSSVFASTKVNSLDEISIFTRGEDRPLSKVFDAIYDMENGGQAIDHKSDAKTLKAYFLSVLPEYDTDRVYVSDIKKVLQWYNLLQKNGMLVREQPDDGSSAEAPAEKASDAEDAATTTEDKAESPK